MRLLEILYSLCEDIKNTSGLCTFEIQTSKAGRGNMHY